MYATCVTLSKECMLCDVVGADACCAAADSQSSTEHAHREAQEEIKGIGAKLLVADDWLVRSLW